MTNESRAYVNGRWYRGPLIEDVEPVPTPTPPPVVVPPPELERFEISDWPNPDIAFQWLQINRSKGNFALHLKDELVFPHSAILELRNMIGPVHIWGKGILQATVPTRATVRFTELSSLVVDDIGVLHSNVAGKREDSHDSAGINLVGTSNAKFNRVQVSKTASAGIWSEKSATKYCENLEYNDCIIRDTLSDGIHNTNGAKNVSLNRCRAYNTGDDSFSAINYPNAGRLIENYWATDCYAESNGPGTNIKEAVGAHFSIEGAVNSGWRNPQSWRSRNAPLRWASMPAWSGASAWQNKNLICAGGKVYDGKQNSSGHPGLFLIYAGNGDQLDLTIDGLMGYRPNAWTGIQINNEPNYRARRVTIKNTNINREGKMICSSFIQRQLVEALTLQNDRFDGVLVS